MSNARRAALHLLNSDWSRGVWKQWLANVFAPPVPPPMPAPVAAPMAPPPVTTPQPVLARAASNSLPAGALGSSCTNQPSEPPDSRTRELRRSEIRARFDLLSDRLLSVEDGLETLLRRSAQRETQERRPGGEGLRDTVARLEHTVSRLEDGLSRVERALGERSRRDSHFPVAPTAPSQPPRASPSSFPQSQLAPRDRSPFSSRGSELDDNGSNEASGINGNLSEVSLSTVLAMLEIERHTGRLKVATDDGMLASFELTEGSVVSSRLSENDSDPLHTLRAALCWKQGRFWFRQQAAEVPSFSPRSIGSLLLEATRQNDESFANVG